MTLALTGGWAWAELSDPPPGEPGQPPPGEPGQPPPGEPTPPLPPLPVPFAWHSDGPLIAVWDADLKITWAASTSENTACRVLNPDGTPDRWPYAPIYDSTLNTYTNADSTDWSLNDPTRTYDLMQLNGISVYLHDAGAGAAANWINGADARCDWISLAALNDHIATVESPSPETFTGIILGRKQPDHQAVPGHPVSEVGMCFYRSYVARARAEAHDHPHHKLIVVDELTHMLQSPFALFQGRENIWSTEDVEDLRRLAREPDATIGDSQRAACDAAWSTLEGTFDPTGAGGWHAPASLDESPVELWAKVNAATVPLFLVPSYMLGLHGGFAAVPPYSTGEPESRAFNEGERLSARSQVLPRLPADPAVGKVWLRYLTTPLKGDFDDLTLRARINGVAQPGSTLYTQPLAGTGVQLARRSELENIYAIDVLLYDAAATVPPIGWSQSTTAPNVVELVLRAEADSNSFQLNDGGAVFDWEDYLDRYADRGFLIWDVEVVYEGHGGGVLETQELAPKDAVGVYTDTSNVEGPCLPGQVCEDNAELRIDHLLDGVMIAQDITVGWPDPSTFGHVPMEEAWQRFIGHACDHLHTQTPDGAPVRCIVDERAWVSDAHEYAGVLNAEDSITRLGAGVEKGDGASVVWLTLEMEDMVETRGRFAPKESTSADYPYRAYLPRLSRNMIGEGIVWEVDVAGATECAGEWTVGWRIQGCPTKWTYGPLVETIEGGGLWESAIPLDALNSFYQLIEEENLEICADLNFVSPEAIYEREYPLTVPLDTRLRFGWHLKDDDAAAPGALSGPRPDAGASLYEPQQVEFRVTPPGGCTLDPEAVTIRALWDAQHHEYYASLTCVMQGGSAEDCL